MVAPFFVVGTQRSGTTLLYQMLGGHPELYLVNEFWDLYAHVTGEVRDEAALEKLLTRHLRLESSYRDPAEPKAALGVFDHVDRAFAAKLAQTGKRRWGIKHPRLTHYLDDFERRYPEAQYVFIVRDPRAVAYSYLTRKMNIANVYHGANLWVEQVQIQRRFSERSPERCHWLRFEELIAEPQPALRRICEFLGVAFSDELLEFHRKRSETKIHAGNINITRPLDRQIAEKWRRALSRRQIAIVESIAADTMRAAGYEPSGDAVRVGRLEKLYYDVHQWVLTNYWWQRRSGWRGLRRRLPFGAAR